MTEPSAFYMEFRPGWRWRLRNRLFPHRRCPRPEPEGVDCVWSTTRVVLSPIDRLRVLVSGRLIVKTETSTQERVNLLASTSTAYVLAPGERYDE